MWEERLIGLLAEREAGEEIAEEAGPM